MATVVRLWNSVKAREHALKVMYDGINACVRTGRSTVTTDFQCGRGLRQGDSLSSILFILFINDLEEFLVQRQCRGISLHGLPFLLMFLADNLSLFDREVKGLQRKLNLLFEYCAKYELTVNLKKTNVIVFRNARSRIRTDEKWTYGGVPIEIVEVYTYLGVEVSSTCKWTETINVRIRKST